MIQRYRLTLDESFSHGHRRLKPGVYSHPWRSLGSDRFQGSVKEGGGGGGGDDDRGGYHHHHVGVRVIGTFPTIGRIASQRLLGHIGTHGRDTDFEDTGNTGHQGARSGERTEGAANGSGVAQAF